MLSLVRIPTGKGLRRRACTLDIGAMSLGVLPPAVLIKCPGCDRALSAIDGSLMVWCPLTGSPSALAGRDGRRTHASSPCSRVVTDSTVGGRCWLLRVPRLTRFYGVVPVR